VNLLFFEGKAVELLRNSRKGEEVEGWKKKEDDISGRLGRLEAIGAKLYALFFNSSINAGNI
jgi:hypothetical protein